MMNFRSWNKCAKEALSINRLVWECVCIPDNYRDAEAQWTRGYAGEIPTPKARLTINNCVRRILREDLQCHLVSV
jgi:hypothetical protein